MLCPPMEYYLAVKKSELQKADFKNMRLNESSQQQKTTYGRIPFSWNIQKQQI